MAGTIKPRDNKDLQQAMAWALNEAVTLDVRGQGSKLRLGKPMQCDQVLDLSGLAGIVDYAPEELVVTVRAGTPLNEVEALLAQRNQMLAFEPPDLGPLLAQEAGQGTLVGTLMGNLAGPRRLSAGAARDHLLGFSGVNGRGEAFKSGGRVMKNVTGYDLSKLLAGSWGTLAVLDEVSVPLGEVLGWKVGSRLELDSVPTSPVRLRCGEAELFSGQMGRRGSSIAVRITDRIMK